MDFSTPRSTLKLYRSGFEGSVCDPEDVRKLLGELPMPIFGAAAYELRHSGEGKVSLPFKALVIASFSSFVDRVGYLANSFCLDLLLYRA